MKQNRAQKLCTYVTSDKHLAAKMMLTVCAPSPEKAAGVPSQRDCARVLGLSQRTMSRVDKVLIEKCWPIIFYCFLLFTDIKSLYYCTSDNEAIMKHIADN